ncbi:MAG: recombination protein RecR [Bacteriovoracaceae bacterium]|nr:recombination protein RecR [Bacteriovoracaceae bacterium]
MIKLPEAIQEVVKSFAKLPGVGEKTAFRQAMSMVQWDAEDLTLFSSAVSSLQTIKFCKGCGVFSDDEYCSVCSSDERKDNGVVCVVENISDLLAIEKSNQFKGIYHILGGVLNPLLGVGPEQLRIKSLEERVEALNIQTVILAINPSVEGDATCSFIKQILKGINVERIGFGIPMGGSLEYLDSLTISKALENRKQL